MSKPLLRWSGATLTAALLLGVPAARAQDPAPPEHSHDMSQMDLSASGAWHLMQDGSFYVLFNRQGGSRGGDPALGPVAYGCGHHRRWNSRYRPGGWSRLSNCTPVP